MLWFDFGRIGIKGLYKNAYPLRIEKRLIQINKFDKL